MCNIPCQICGDNDTCYFTGCYKPVKIKSGYKKIFLFFKKPIYKYVPCGLCYNCKMLGCFSYIVGVPNA